MQFIVTTTDASGTAVTTVLTAQELEANESIHTLLARAQHGSVTIARA